MTVPVIAISNLGLTRCKFILKRQTARMRIIVNQSLEARAEFRVDKEDIPLLVNALQVPEYFRCPQGTGKAVHKFTCLLSFLPI